MPSPFKNPMKPTAEEMERLERRLAFYKKQIAEMEATEKRARLATHSYTVIQAAYASLTAEEKLAAEGMYIFIHGGMVDLVKQQPSPTDEGEGREFTKMMAKAQAIALQLQNAPAPGETHE